MEGIKIPLRALVDTAKMRLQELQYAPATINAFSRYWRELLEYADERRIQYFSVTLGEDYLREVCHINVVEGTQDPNLPRWKVNPPKRAVYLLADLQNSGSVLRKLKEKYTPIPSCYLEVTAQYYAVCRRRYNGEGTIRIKKFTVGRFLLHLEQRGIRCVREMKGADISSFLCAMTGWAPRTVASSVCNLRQFLVFLYQGKYTDRDFSSFLPTVPNGRNGRLPNIWPRESVQKMLDSIDRANPIGKRDYAILLMVTQLGLRDSDIQNLKYESFVVARGQKRA